MELKHSESDEPGELSVDEFLERVREVEVSGVSSCLVCQAK